MRVLCNSRSIWRFCLLYKYTMEGSEVQERSSCYKCGGNPTSRLSTGVHVRSCDCLHVWDRISFTM